MLKCGQALLFYFPPWHVDLWYPCQRSFSHWFFTLRSVSSPVYNWATHNFLSSTLTDNFCPNGSAAEKSLQSCPNLCDPIDGSPPGSPVPGILEARIREWVAISFSNTWKWKVKVKSLSPVWLRDPMDCSLPGSSEHRIFQARVLEWGAIAFSKSTS